MVGWQRIDFIGDMRKAMSMVDVTATGMSNLNRDFEVGLTVAVGICLSIVCCYWNK
jgi:hypothetical protein